MSKKKQSMHSQKIIIWDNDGTIMGSKNPHDTSDTARIILPNVEKVMIQTNALNIICSGCKTEESEKQHFDPEKIIERFKILMNRLPIAAATFSPKIGGIECYVIIKRSSSEYSIKKAHEDARYAHLIGQFKKPGIGMLVVIKDILKEELGHHNSSDLLMIGDTWHDKQAAHDANIAFIEAQSIHQLSEETEISYDFLMKNWKNTCKCN